jgi:hypothetical protein
VSVKKANDVLFLVVMGAVAYGVFRFLSGLKTRSGTLYDHAVDTTARALDTGATAYESVVDSLWHTANPGGIPGTPGGLAPRPGDRVGYTQQEAADCATDPYCVLRRDANGVYRPDYTQGGRIKR